MKLNFDIKNKKGGLEADVERLVEKGMDQHEKSWREKFDTKHSAKKEMLEIKHKHKMDLEENNKNKKNWIQKIAEEKRKLKEMELAEQRRIEEEQRKRDATKLTIKIISTIVLAIIGALLFIIGSILGSESGDPNSGWHAMAVLGLFPLMGIGAIWISGTDDKKKRKK